jgi:two-component system sensor histidine kinase KdpD
MQTRETTVLVSLGTYAGRQWAVPQFKGLAASALFLAAAILIGSLLRSTLPAASVSLIFLIAVLLSAVSYGFWTGITTAGFAFLAYNFFFVEPLHTFRVAQVEDFLALGVLLLVASLTGSLAGRMREEADAARNHAAMLERISKFTGELVHRSKVPDIETAMLRHLALAAGGSAVLLKRTENGLSVLDSVPPDVKLEPADLQSADKCHRSRIPQAATAPGWSGSQFAFYPLTFDQTADCVIGVSSRPSDRRRPSSQDHAITAIFKQGQVALERAAFAQKAGEARIEAQREALRSALLSSLSHDLRTPLAAILGSVTSLRQLSDTLSPAARDDLLLAIEEETGRLSRYVSNLLHMTRLQAGIDTHLDWVDPVDIAQGTIVRARKSFPGRKIAFYPAGPMPLIHSDAALLDQALFNLIDNAIKFSPPETPVEISIARTDHEIELSVTDLGQGIPAAELDHIFEPFYRSQGKRGMGAGLGLAICNGIIHALGGAIAAKSPLNGDRGTAMRIKLPIGKRQPP